MAIRGQFAADRFVGRAGVFPGAVDKMQEHAAAFDMAEKTVAETVPLVRAFDQSGDVGQHEFATVDIDHAKLGMQRREGIVGDLGLGGADRGKEG